MAQARLDKDLARAVLAARREHATHREAARAMNVPLQTFIGRVHKAQDMLANGELDGVPDDAPFVVDDLPDELPTADELLQRRSKQFHRKKEAKEARALVPVSIRLDGPIGLMHMGDPHVDDDGTNIDLLRRHVDLANKTDGLFACNVGDFSNNWVGRLARLYGQQSLSAAEAWVLVEWLVKSTRWLYLIGGNHDLWSGAGDPIQWMAKSARVSYEAHGMRLGLTFPNGRVIRVNARHDFSGHSQWNTAHGPAKAAQMGWRDHILTCGHLHTSGYNVVRDPASGLISHALRVGSYKTYDRYAEERGLPNQTFTVAPVTVIDPEQPDDSPRCVTVFLDPEEGAEFLTFKRKRWAKGR
jgi:hypothetical protein